MYHGLDINEYDSYDELYMFGKSPLCNKNSGTWPPKNGAGFRCKTNYVTRVSASFSGLLYDRGFINYGC